MTEFFVVALFIPADRTIADVHRILSTLDDMDFCYDGYRMDFEDNGMFFDARCEEDWIVMLGKLESIDGLEIDWDTMSDWDDDVEEEE